MIIENLFLFTFNPKLPHNINKMISFGFITAYLQMNVKVIFCHQLRQEKKEKMDLKKILTLGERQTTTGL